MKYLQVILNKGKVGGCIAPTQQMIMKWLREIYGIYIVIEISDPSVNDRKYYSVILDKNNDSHILELFDSYEEAVEAALKYCFENIKLRKIQYINIYEGLYSKID